ncbi:MAG: glycoside hydrolase family 31 protein [Oscillatoria sp. PMC 1051.18]|nr:glycoside hydrolase family 31 protein [Oscillatoria sp. PMC 1050.18]MEC5030610.1 glycoside hydrolase family 31 protein [Oscillatoria sp. PMC 1051.18]
MNLYQQIALNLRPIKLKRFLGSLYYSRLRDRVERRFSPPQPKDDFVAPGNLLTSEPVNNGAKLKFEQAELEIYFLTPDFVRIDWKPGIPPVAYAIAGDDWEDVETSFEKNSDKVIVSSSNLKVKIASDGSLEFANTDGKIIRQELPPQHQNEAWKHQGKLYPEEHIYGLGERAASFNLRAQPDRSYKMWHYDAGGIYTSETDPLYLCIPVYLGLHQQGSYLIFYENSYLGYFTFNEQATAYFAGGALRYYFTIGEPPELLTRYAQLTGYPVLPPRWAFGYHQSRWGYETEAKVREVVAGFHTHNLPVSAIHLDIDCKDRFRSFTIDPDRFPQLSDFNRELAAKNVKLIAIVNPGVKQDNNNQLYREGIAQDVFCKLPDGTILHAPVWPGMCAFPDFTNPLARHWWSRQYEYLLDLGVSGFWHDMNEPGVFTLWGDATLPTPTQHFLEGRGGTHLEAHNLYGLMQAKAGYEALREYCPNQRPFIVSRSGWAGLQCYAWTWTGDVETSWSGLRLTVPTVLGMSLSGIPYAGPDIGGFKGNPTPELYLRWFQMAAFLPFFRTHSANNVKPRTPWSYGEEILEITRKYLHLRYRLIPYFYTLAWEATEKGYPSVRPLFWHDSSDERLWDVEDEFFVGDALLVCPIVEEGVRDRQVILPPGNYYNFWDDTVFAGNSTIKLEAPWETIPLLVKAGSILPMEAEEKLILHLYSPVGEETSFANLYSDAGDGYKEWRLDKFQMRRNTDMLELVWEQSGDYPFSYQSLQIYVHGLNVDRAWIEDKKVKMEGDCLECQSFEKIRFKVN